MGGTASYITNIDYAASGQVNETYLGNGVVSQSCYDANNLRLAQIRAYPGSLTSCVNANPANTRFSLSYQQYDNVGNLKQVFDATRNETINYNYDDLDRLLSVTGAYSQNFGYNAIGNLTNKAGVTLNYPASGQNSVRPHAVTSLSTGETYSYDANGNMTQRVEGGLTLRLRSGQALHTQRPSFDFAQDKSRLGQHVARRQRQHCRQRRTAVLLKQAGTFPGPIRAVARPSISGGLFH